MNKPLKAGTRLLPAAPEKSLDFKISVSAGRCRKEFSPGFKEYIVQTEDAAERIQVSKTTILQRIVLLHIPDFKLLLRFTLSNAIGFISHFLTHNSVLEQVLYPDTIKKNTI